MSEEVYSSQDLPVSFQPPVPSKGEQVVHATFNSIKIGGAILLFFALIGAFLYLMYSISLKLFAIALSSSIFGLTTFGYGFFFEIKHPKTDYPIIALRHVSPRAQVGQTAFFAYYEDTDGYRRLCMPTFGLAFKRWLFGIPYPIIVYNDYVNGPSGIPQGEYMERLIIDDFVKTTRFSVATRDWIFNGGFEDGNMLLIHMDQIHSLSLEEARNHITNISTWADGALRYAKRLRKCIEEKLRLEMGIDNLAFAHMLNLVKWHELVERNVKEAMKRITDLGDIKPSEITGTPDTMRSPQMIQQPQVEEIMYQQPLVDYQRQLTGTQQGQLSASQEEPAFKRRHILMDKSGMLPDLVKSGQQPRSTSQNMFSVLDQRLASLNQQQRQKVIQGLLKSNEVPDTVKEELKRRYNEYL